MANYITLTTSNSSLSKRFKALEMNTPLLRMDTFDFTLGGKTDKQAGPVIRQWKYLFRVPIDTAEGTEYGSYSDFATFFALGNANATPSDVITMTDHWGGTQHTFSVYFEGDAIPTPLTTQITGGNAWYTIPVSFLEKN